MEHTFGTAEDPCDPNDRNDFVDDTPVGRATEFNCPVGKDTCALLPGDDPIHNFMDYSSDECYESFSRGQMDRMYYVWSLYRRNGEACSGGFVLFELDVFLTDGGGGDNAFELRSEDREVYWTGGNESLNLIPVTFQDGIVNRLDICIETSKTYEFILYDNAANGLGEGGYYQVRVNGASVRPLGLLPIGQREEMTTFRGDGSLSDNPYLLFFAVLTDIIELIIRVFGGGSNNNQ